MKSPNQIDSIKQEFRNVKMNSKILHFKLLYYNMSNLKKYSILLVLALFTSLINVILVKSNGIYVSGLSGLSVGLARMLKIYSNSESLYNIFYWVFTLILNIPLIIFSYYKIDKGFSIRTTFWMISSILIGISISFIPGIDKIYIFGSIEEKFSLIMPWKAGNNQPFSLLFYSLFFFFLNGAIFSLIYIMGSSTGGTDFIAFYWSKKNPDKSIAYTLTIIGILFLFSGTIIGSYIPNIMSDNYIGGHTGSRYDIDLIFSPNFVVSLFGMFFQTFIISKIYPRDKKIKVEIITNISEILSNAIIKSGYNHAFTVTKVTGGYTNKEKFQISSICTYYESAKLVSLILENDPDCFVSYTDIKGISGRFSLPK